MRCCLLVASMPLLVASNLYLWIHCTRVAGGVMSYFKRVSNSHSRRVSLKRVTSGYNEVLACEIDRRLNAYYHMIIVLIMLSNYERLFVIFRFMTISSWNSS